MRTAVFVSSLSVVSFGANAPAAFASDQGRHKHITYVEVDANFTDANVAAMRTDGSHHRLLSPRPGFDVAPEYSPNGQRIAFTSGRSAPAGSENDPRYSEAYVMNADGSHVRRITTNVGRLDLAPSWAPHGRRLVLGRGPAAVHGRTDLWIINLTTGRERRLTHSRGTTEEVPDWSPDGRRIVFVGDLADPGNFDIYTIRPNGSGLRRLTRSPAFDADAHFSPDGRSIVFGSDRTGNADVFVMRRNGSDVRRITRHPSFDAFPVFSDNGRSIAFVSERDSAGVNDIFRMRRDGTHVRNLTNSPDLQEFEPDWQP